VQLRPAVGASHRRGELPDIVQSLTSHPCVPAAEQQGVILPASAWISSPANLCVLRRADMFLLNLTPAVTYSCMNCPPCQRSVLQPSQFVEQVR